MVKAGKKIILRKILIIILLVSIVYPTTLIAQDVDTLSVSDGLPHNTVFSVFKDNSNNIWVGTEGGIGRWISDEQPWQEYNTENSKLVNNKVNAILQDNDGYLWFGTDHGISKFDGQNWVNYTRDSLSTKIRAEQITSLFIDSKSNLWIATLGGGVTKRSISEKGVQWIPYDIGNSGIISNNISAINEDKMGNLWFGTYDSGICKFDGNSNWTSYPENELIGNKINVIYKDQYDTLWVGTYNRDGTSNGVVRTYDGSRWNSYENIPAVQSIVEDRDGNLWFGTEDANLYKSNRIHCSKIEIIDWKLEAKIWSMIRDHNGYLWLGTNGAGVSRLQLNWQKFDSSDVGSTWNFSVTGIAGDSNGNLWFATALQGIVKYDGAAFQILKVNGEDKSNNTNSIIVDNNNLLWVASDNGVHVFDCVSNEWIISYDESVLAHKTVKTILQDKSGNYWFGTNGGVCRFDGADWRTINTTDSLPDNIVKAIYEDHRGHFWFGTSKGGVCELAGDSVTAVYNTSNGLLDNTVTTIIQDKELNYWFGTEKGISRFYDTDWDSLTKNNCGLTDNNVNCLFKDFNDNIWVGTSNGGLVKSDGSFWVDYSKEFLNTNNIKSIFQDLNKIFWFGTSEGLVKYTPDKIAPETFITFHPETIIGTASTLFVFNGSDTETPNERLVYSWSLMDCNFVDIQDNWSDFIEETYYEVGPLPNGTYIFSVKAKDEDGNVDQSPANFKFLVDTTPPTTIINHPTNNEIVSGEVAVIGTAFDTMSIVKDFKKYWLDYAEGKTIESISPSDWKIINDTMYTNIINDELISWDAAVSYGSIFLRLSAIDTLRHLSQFTVRVNSVGTLKEFRRDRGGSINGLQNHIQLYIPPGALKDDVKIFSSPLIISEDSLPRVEKISYSTMAYFIGPDTLHFKKPAALTFNYADSTITDLNENKLSLLHLDDFQLLGGFINSETNKIRTTISKLGTYILVEDNTTKEGQHTISEVNCQPRIFSPRGTGFAEKTTISFRLMADLKISIKVYNLAGRLVRILLENKLVRAGYIPLDWDGHDYNGEICPSDLYVVTIESDKEVKTKTVMILDKSNN